MTRVHGAETETAEELQRLRRCLGDVIALSALPAVWAGSDPEYVADGLADVLIRTVSLDFVYVRVQLSAGSTPLQVVRTGSDANGGIDPNAVRKVLEAWLQVDESVRPATIPVPDGDGVTKVAAAPLGYAPQVGVVVVGTQRSEFPTEQDRVLLGVAANQAAVVLQSLATGQQLSRSKQQLERERRQLQEVFTLAPAFNATLRGPEHIFEIANPAYLQLIGFRDVIGKPIREALPEIAGQGYLELLDEVYRTGESFVGKERSVRIARGPDGALEEIFVNFVYQPLRDADGTVSGIFVHGVDVTEQVRARAGIRESEARFRQLADAMPQMVWTARPDGYLDYYNQRWYEFTGFPEGKGGDPSWIPILHPEDVQPCLDTWYAAVRTGKPYVMEYRFWDRHRKEYRWHLGRALPVRDEQGQIVRWFGTSTDIDDQKRAAERLREETRTVETINHVGQSLAAELDIQKLLQAVTDAGTELTGAEFGAFFYNSLDERGEMYSLYTLSGAPRSAFERFPMPRNTPIFAPTFTGKGVVRLDDVTQDPRYGHNPPYQGMPEGHLPVRSYLAIPVISRSGEVVGGLFFGHREKGVFAERAERIVVGIAAQAAVAIDNARLYQQVTTELAERKRAEALLTAQKNLLEQIARGAGLAMVLDALARMVEEQSEGALCSLLLRDEHGGLHQVAAPSLPQGYSRAIDGMRIGPTAGSCGTAAYRRERVVTADIATDPLWKEYREIALAHGLRACCSIPILSSIGAVLGCVSMYYQEPREPATGDSAVAVVATHLAGIAIERARTEEALRESETLLRTIIDTEPECVKLMDRDGTLRLMNLAGLQMIEAEGMEQVVGKSVFGLIAAEDRAAFEDMHRRIFQGESMMLQFAIVGLKGTRRYMETHAVPLRDPEGEVVAHLAVTRDITERKRDEQELARRAAELAERDREKDEFLAMLAHELRNPLAPIMNAAQVLQARSAEDPPLHRQAVVIDRQARHMARLLDDLLDVSRITRNKIELRKQVLDFGATVEQAVEATRPLVQQRRHQLRVSIPPEPLYVDADPTRVHQVVGNLLNNAAKYTEPGGRIALAMEREGEEVVLRVSDTGIGIPPEFLPRVFDLFTQGDRSISRSESGLGIGLTMVQRLVQLHGGTVGAHSDGIGQGSEFTARWPLAATGELDASTAAATTLAASARTPRRILIVDDNADAADTLADLAALWGHEVRAVKDGFTALRAATEYRPEVILLDISMPGMSGYEVARAVRQDPSLEGVLLIALTGYGQDEDRRRTHEAGFDHHLTKPVDPELLRRLLADG